MINANDGFNFDKAAEIDSKLKTGKGDVIMSTAKELIEKGRQQGIQQRIQLIQGIRRGIQQGMLQGVRQGIQQGVQRGIQQAVQLIINDMLEKGYTLDEIRGTVKTIVDELNKMQTDPEVLKLYEAARKWELDYNTDIEVAKKEGIQRGIQQGTQLIINNILEKDYTFG